MKKLRMVVGQVADGSVVDFTLATTLGWDNKLWSLLLPGDGRQIGEAGFLRAANYVRGLVCWPARDVTWFRYHAGVGLLGPELEAMQLDWSIGTSRYHVANPRRASNSETMWLRSMGCLPGNIEGLVQDLGHDSAVRSDPTW